MKLPSRVNTQSGTSTHQKKLPTKQRHQQDDDSNYDNTQTKFDGIGKHTLAVTLILLEYAGFSLVSPLSHSTTLLNLYGSLKMVHPFAVGRGIMLIAIAAILLCNIPAHVTGAPASSVNVTVFSFSLDLSLPPNSLDDERGSQLWSQLRSDISTLTQAPPSRIYRLEMEWKREQDTAPDIVLFEKEKEFKTLAEAAHDTPSPLRHLPSLFARSSSSSSSSPSSHKFHTQSLELIRVSFAFMPAGFQLDGSYSSIPSSNYIDLFRNMLHDWRVTGGDASSLTEPNLSYGNITRLIHPIIPMTIEDTVLTYCPDEPRLQSYYVTCPIPDPVLYSGQTGLTVAVILAIVILLIVALVVWWIYTKAENKRRRGNISQVKPEYRAIIFGSHNTKFKQHTLDVWEPVWRVRDLTKIFLILGVGLFMPLGIWMTRINSEVHEIRVRYDHLPECAVSSTSTNENCHVLIPIDTDMKAPVYMYYHITNFFQNHRNYVMSRSDAQLRNAGNKGSSSAPNIGTECAALRRFGDWDRERSPAYYPFQQNVTDLLSSKTLYPCGLIAASFFNDRFDSASITSSRILQAESSGTPYTGPKSFRLEGRNWDATNIAWTSDRNGKFRSRPLDTDHETNLNPRGLPPNSRHDGTTRKMQLADVEDQDFIVWMRVAPFSSFAKLSHAILDRDLRGGEILNLTVTNRFDVSHFQGEKAIILATMNPLGGKNAFFATVYLLMFAVYTVTGIIFYLLFRNDPDPISPEMTLQLALDAQAEIEMQQAAQSLMPIQTNTNPTTNQSVNGTNGHSNASGAVTMKHRSKKSRTSLITGLAK